jgi:hypothetical protein
MPYKPLHPFVFVYPPPPGRVAKGSWHMVQDGDRPVSFLSAVSGARVLFPEFGGVREREHGRTLRWVFARADFVRLQARLRGEA